MASHTFALRNVRSVVCHSAAKVIFILVHEVLTEASPVNGFTVMTVILSVAIGAGITAASTLPVDFDKLNQQQPAQ